MGFNNWPGYRNALSSVAMSFSTVVVTDLHERQRLGQQGQLAQDLDDYNLRVHGAKHYDTYYEQLKAEIRDWLK